MTGVEKLKKRYQERAEEIRKLSGDMDTLKAQRERLGVEINNAIDTGDTAQAERLVNRQHEIDVKMEVARRTIARKTDQGKDLAELITAANADTAAYQKKIDQAAAAELSAKKKNICPRCWMWPGWLMMPGRSVQSIAA